MKGSKNAKQKQLTDRPQVGTRFTDSTPLLTRLQKQYLFNQQQPQKTSREYMMRNGDKQNLANMVNSVQNSEQYLSHNVIKIDNYQGKRFKTQQGYEPMMTKSRYMVEKEQQQKNLQNAAIYKSSQNIVLRKDKIKKTDNKFYDSIDLTQNERPLTFGLVRKTEPMKSSLQYQQDNRLKNQILDQLNNLRKSQQTLYGSKDYTGSGFADVLRCVNHNNRKAKYRLLSQSQSRQQQDMIYCSKCAINLLQQGFKVQQIKPSNSNPIARKISTNQNQYMGQNTMISSTGAPSRIQEMRNFEHKLNDVELKINQSLQQSSVKTNQIQQIERQIWQTESLHDQMIEYLHKMKETQVMQLKQKKKKKISNLQKYQKQMTHQLDSIKQMKKQMREYRNKFVIMKQNQFQFLISSFLNKIQSYGNQYKEGEHITIKIQDQIDQIIIDLCQYCKTIKQIDQSRYSIMDKNNQKYQQCQDDFICKQIKGPFRTLFPEDEQTSSEKNNFDNCVTGQDDSPSFNKHQAKMMKKSVKNCQQIKNQYY